MEIWGIVGSLLGVALGWGLTQLSTLLGTRQADRRTLKKTLYFLLELRSLLRKLDRFNRQLPEHIARLRRHLPAPAPGEEAALDEKIGSALRAMQVPVLGPKFIALKAGYEAGLLKLATIDPVSAYRLRGLDELLQQIPIIMGALKKTGAARAGTSPKLFARVADFFHQHFQPDSIRQDLQLVQEMIEALAARLDDTTQASLQAEWARESKREENALIGFDEFMEKARAAFPEEW